MGRIAYAESKCRGFSRGFDAMRFGVQVSFTKVRTSASSLPFYHHINRSIAELTVRVHQATHISLLPMLAPSSHARKKITLKHNAAVEHPDPSYKRSSQPVKRTAQRASLPSPEDNDGFPATDSSTPHPAIPAYLSAPPSYQSAPRSCIRHRDARDSVPSTRPHCPCTRL